MKVETLEIIFKAFNHAQVKYIVAGGIAVNIHGYQRMTSDLDIAIALSQKNIQRAINCLETLKYKTIIPIQLSEFCIESNRLDWHNNRNMEVLSLQSDQHPETTIDIFVTDPFNFDQEYLTSNIIELSPDISFKVVSLNTLILMKQAAGRAKDMDDIEHLKMIRDKIE